ncbi:hypothetical protein CCR94_16795 [Rhodoblastus sphagnicola]|uniref:Uncharacterized protein n=2 Tax=Rhodoblastus sphagnicola TaxID=333368 RepID=A0A2S6N2I3_9HYPH|nr:hypothetical protein CCR94_16795 [Rhodoblastus sphagnicola]
MFGIGLSAETISTLRLAGIVPLLAALAAYFIFRQSRVLVLAVGTLVYLLYQASIFLFVYQI